jgi:hypothetical protein
MNTEPGDGGATIENGIQRAELYLKSGGVNHRAQTEVPNGLCGEAISPAMDWFNQMISRRADKLAGWAAVALGFSIPISTALDEILLVVILALWLVGGHFRDKIRAVRHNPVVLPALVLFGMYLLGLV